MQLICISRGTFSGGKSLAQKLARNLDYECLSWEDLVDAANREGIQVGKLEMATVNPAVFSRRLVLEKEQFLAFATSYMCSRLMESPGLVYHGRAGHHKLAGVSHILRVRVLADYEQRINMIMQERRLDRQKAARYISAVDEDRKRWAYSMYGVSLEDPANYDMIVNLAGMNTENAASALVSTARLPDFQMTPADVNTLKNLDLAARTRLTLAKDERTHGASVKVRADKGVVTVTYLPQDAAMAEFIPAVCAGLAGLKQVHATMAMTNILWIQEEFHPDSDLCDQMVEIATKWNAAVELIKLEPEDKAPAGAQQTVVEPDESFDSEFQGYNGGIENDSVHTAEDDSPLRKTLDKLAREGRSGGGRVVYGGQRQLINAIDPATPYTLVVIGEILSSSGHAAVLRATRDLRNFLGERFKAPVITADELGSQYLFGKRDMIRAGACLAVTVVLFFLVFGNQEFVLAFLSQSGWFADAVEHSFPGATDWAPGLVVSAAVFLLIPVVAFCYGTLASSILKLIKME
jgi:cytidylate kinase